MAFEKIVLFDGTNLDMWTKTDGTPADWIINGDGSMTVNHGNIVSTVKYKDAHIHVEFYLPMMADRTGQGRANSGVYIQGCYECQVLDSYGVAQPQSWDCSGIYQQFNPLTNANLPPETWQTYDIYFRAPKYEGDQIVEDARLTVIFNGVCVHNNLTLPANTPGGISGRVPEGPLLLQDHGDPVRYRNIYIEKLN